MYILRAIGTVDLISNFRLNRNTFLSLLLSDWQWPPSIPTWRYNPGTCIDLDLWPLTLRCKYIHVGDKWLLSNRVSLWWLWVQEFKERALGRPINFYALFQRLWKRATWVIAQRELHSLFFYLLVNDSNGVGAVALALAGMTARLHPETFAGGHTFAHFVSLSFG